jgi:hypothetical protein
MSTFTQARLYQGQPSTGEATLYTVPSSTSVIVKQIVLCNTSASTASISLSIVPSGGTAGSANRIVGGYTVPANATQTLDMSQVMNTSDFISGLQGTASTVTVTISGVTIQ